MTWVFFIYNSVNQNLFDDRHINSGNNNKGITRFLLSHLSLDVSWRTPDGDYSLSDRQVSDKHSYCIVCQPLPWALYRMGVNTCLRHTTNSHRVRRSYEPSIIHGLWWIWDIRLNVRPTDKSKLRGTELRIILRRTTSQYSCLWMSIFNTSDLDLAFKSMAEARKAQKMQHKSVHLKV